MVKSFWIFLLLVLMLLEVTSLATSSEISPQNKILGIVQKMISEFEKIRDFTFETEVIYYKEGLEDEQWHIKFFFKKNKKFRVDFYHPYKGVSVFYKGGEEEVTVRPLRFIPVVKFHLSIDNSMVKAPSGQRIDQTDIEYFIRFIFKNLKSIQQRENEFQEDGEQIKFSFWALDYIEGKYLEKYRVFVSNKIWFPIRVERYNLGGEPVEVIIFKNHVINANLEDKLFLP